MTADLNIAEIPYESGAIRYRYSRVLSEDRTRWVRHGLFVEYSQSGTTICEGTYIQGEEQGLWRTFHENGQIASEGSYVNGREDGVWQFWNPSGQEEPPVRYSNGEEVASQETPPN